MAGLRPINPTALVRLKVHRPWLTMQEYRTLRGQVLAGDDAGAMKGLDKILLRREQNLRESEGLLGEQNRAD